MTVRDLLQFQFDAVGGQLRGCLKDMSEAAADQPAAPGGMTPRAQVEHLCEAYHAFMLHRRGEKHDWGTYAIDDKSLSNLLATWDRLRGEATAMALESADDDEAARNACDYIIGHDSYHVGQLVLARSQAEPEWNSYSIYT